MTGAAPVRVAMAPTRRIAQSTKRRAVQSSVLRDKSRLRFAMMHGKTTIVGNLSSRMMCLQCRLFGSDPGKGLRATAEAAQRYSARAEVFLSRGKAWPNSVGTRITLNPRKITIPRNYATAPAMDAYRGLGVFYFFEMFFPALGTYKRKRAVAKIDIGFHISPPLT
jgi:hypothetical protein